MVTISTYKDPEISFLPYSFWCDLFECIKECV